MKQISAHSGRHSWFKRKHDYHLSHDHLQTLKQQKLRPETLQWQAGTVFISLFSRLALPWNSIFTAAVKPWNLRYLSKQSFASFANGTNPRYHDEPSTQAMQSASRLPPLLCRRGMIGRHDGQRLSHSWDAWMAPSPSSHATSSLVHRFHFPWSEWLPNHDAPLSFGNARSSGNIGRTYWNRYDGRAICQTRCKSVSGPSWEDRNM